MVAKQSRREGVYNRAGDLSVTCFGKEEQRNECEAIKKIAASDMQLATTWLGWQNPTRQALSLATILCPFCFAKDGLSVRILPNNLNKKQQMHFCICCFWLGWQDSNLRMQQSKCCVLPLDDTPILSLLSILIFQNIQIL